MGFESIFMLAFKDFETGRLIESLIFLTVMLWRLKPHMNKIEERMEGVENGLNKLEKSMSSNFKAGNERFNNIEKKLDDLDDRVEVVEEIIQP